MSLLYYRIFYVEKSSPGSSYCSGRVKGFVIVKNEDIIFVFENTIAPPVKQTEIKRSLLNENTCAGQYL